MCDNSHNAIIGCSQLVSGLDHTRQKNVNLFVCRMPSSVIHSTVTCKSRKVGYNGHPIASFPDLFDCMKKSGNESRSINYMVPSQLPLLLSKRI